MFPFRCKLFRFASPHCRAGKHPGKMNPTFRNPADWVAVSPYHQLRQATPPMLAVCSTRRADACPQAQALAEKAQGLGASIVVLPQDMTHGEINAQLGQDGDYTNRVEHFIGGLSPRLAERLR